MALTLDLGYGVFVEAQGEGMEEDVAAGLGEANLCGDGPLFVRDLFIKVLHNSGRKRQQVDRWGASGWGKQ